MLRKLLLLALLGPAALPAGEIHRCVGAAGEPAFSQRPCDRDRAGTVVTVPTGDPRAVGDGLRASERAWLAERERKHRRGGGAVRRKTRQDPGRQAYRCREKRRALDAVSARLRRGYKPAAGERLRRRRQSYADYLSTFCS